MAPTPVMNQQPQSAPWVINPPPSRNTDLHATSRNAHATDFPSGNALVSRYRPWLNRQTTDKRKQLLTQRAFTAATSERRVLPKLTLSKVLPEVGLLVMSTIHCMVWRCHSDTSLLSEAGTITITTQRKVTPKRQDTDRRAE